MCVRCVEARVEGGVRRHQRDDERAGDGWQRDHKGRVSPSLNCLTMNLSP